MMPNMYFIYSLSCEGQIFYIGKTKNMAARYIAHLSAHPLTTVGKHINTLLAAGKAIKMHQIDYLAEKEAWEREREMKLIYDLSKAGQSICNYVFKYNPGWDHDKIPDNLPKKQMIKFIKYMQGMREYMYAYHNKLEIWDSMECPDYPFEKK